MTHARDTPATDAQRGDHSPGRGRADADDGSPAEQPETAAERDDADRQRRERSVVVGDAAGAPAATVRVPAAASPAEADAIVAAIEEHLAATEDAPGGTDRWVAAGRIREAVSDPGSALDAAGSDPWTAASRAHR